MLLTSTNYHELRSACFVSKFHFPDRHFHLRKIVFGNTNYWRKGHSIHQRRIEWPVGHRPSSGSPCSLAYGDQRKLPALLPLVYIGFIVDCRIVLCARLLYCSSAFLDPSSIHRFHAVVLLFTGHFLHTRVRPLSAKVI